MGILRFSRTTILLVAAFTVGIVVSGFIIGLTFYTPYQKGGVTSFDDTASARASAEVSELASSLGYGSKEEPPTGLETVNRMIIYTARLELKVNDVDSAMNEVRDIAESIGGFVSGASTSKRDGGRTGVITVRVPHEDFYTTVLALEELGEVESKDVKGKDVTEQYIDLKARLTNFERQDQRLTEILAMCETVEEVLRVESELNRVRGEIERLTGQVQYMEARVDLGSITVLLSEGKPWVEMPHVDWGAAVKAGLWGVFTVLQGLVALAIGITPFVAIGTPVYYVYRWRKQTKSENSKD